MKNYLIVAALVISSCTTPYRAKELEIGKLETKGGYGDSKIGINEKKQIVIRVERSASTELYVQEMVNSKIRSDAENELYMLKLCRRDLADPRLGGSGKASPIPSLDALSPNAEETESLGVDEHGDLKVVKEVFFEEKLMAAKKAEKALRSALELAETQREECESQMAQARVKAGLPGKRAVADGYFTGDGVWVQIGRTEHTLDDGFEIQAKRAGRNN